MYQSWHNNKCLSGYMAIKEKVKCFRRLRSPYILLLDRKLLVLFWFPCEWTPLAVSNVTYTLMSHMTLWGQPGCCLFPSAPCEFPVITTSLDVDVITYIFKKAYFKYLSKSPAVTTSRCKTSIAFIAHPEMSVKTKGSKGWDNFKWGNF